MEIRINKEPDHAPNTVGISSGNGVWTNYHIDTIASCKPAMPVGYIDYLTANQEGEKPMCKSCYNQPMASAVNVTAAQAPVEATQRDYANYRVRSIVRKLDSDLRKKFFLDAHDRPQTAADLIRMIKEDDFTLDQKKIDEAGNEIRYFGSDFGITWGKDSPDWTGYTAAKKALDEAAQEVVDNITLSAPDKLLDLLNEFKVWTYKA